MSIKQVHKIISLKKFELLWHANNFADCFTNSELEQYGKEQKKHSLSARYMAKSCIQSITGKTIRLNEIEILNDDMGKPILSFSDEIKEALKEDGIKNISCSLSHSQRRSAALIVFEDDSN